MHTFDDTQNIPRSILINTKSWTTKTFHRIFDSANYLKLFSFSKWFTKWKWCKIKVKQNKGKVEHSSWNLPRPLRPTKRRSLNLATWFFITAVQLRSSPHQLSSFPARIVTIVPSPTSVRATTLNATGNVLLERQWFGNAEHKIYGLPVRTAKSTILFYFWIKENI